MKAKNEILNALTLTQARKWNDCQMFAADVLPADMDISEKVEMERAIKQVFERILECAAICEPPSELDGQPKEWTWADQSKMDARTGRNLPVIIDAPGLYLTRRGHKAQVESAGPNGFTFCCKGYVLLPPKGKRKKGTQKWNTWQPNGRNRALDEHPDDIVQRVE